ncbi:MAG: hypothetical protein HY883_05140 [Deltaproteobacteria bacterium]|nr:hypothetical protein [Deltaproteobacteria bacterium]
MSPRFRSSINGFYNDLFEGPMGLFVDRSNNEVYVVDIERGEVFIYDTSGTPLFRFGGAGGIASPIDVAVYEGRLYLSEEGKAYVGVFDFRGMPAGKLSMPPGKEFLPGRMDVDENGGVYVVNRALGECDVFDKGGGFLRAIGKDLFSLSGVAVGGDMVYLITPFYTGNAIHAYRKSSEHVASFEAIEGRGGTLGLPSSAKVDPGGNLWVVDSLKGIIIYGFDGGKIGGRKIGAFGQEGPSGGTLEFPVDIDFSSDGMIYIIDKEGKRLVVFK